MLKPFLLLAIDLAVITIACMLVTLFFNRFFFPNVFVSRNKWRLIVFIVIVLMLGLMTIFK